NPQLPLSQYVASVLCRLSIRRLRVRAPSPSLARRPLRDPPGRPLSLAGRDRWGSDFVTVTPESTTTSLPDPTHGGRALAARELEARPLHRDPSVGGTDGSYATASMIRPAAARPERCLGRLALPLGMIDQGIVSATN